MNDSYCLCNEKTMQGSHLEIDDLHNQLLKALTYLGNIYYLSKTADRPMTAYVNDMLMMC